MNQTTNNKQQTTHQLVNLVVDAERAKVLKKLAMSLPDVQLNSRQLCDFEMLSNGVYSPLRGFMGRTDYESVLDRMQMQDGTFWPIPICLDISEMTARNFEVGQSVALRDPEGFLLGVMHIEDVWSPDRESEAIQIYGTNDPDHPGVNYLLDMAGTYYVGGQIETISLPIHYDFRQHRFSPQEVRAECRRMGWKKIVGFQTRNPIHRPQFEITIRAMQEAGANLLLLPMVDLDRPGNFDHYTRINCYEQVARHYPPDSFMFNLMPMAMRAAGNRSALLHAMIAKNFGCSHFIVGRDHSGVGSSIKNKGTTGVSDAKALSEEFSAKLGIFIIPFEEMVYLPLEDEYRSQSEVPATTITVPISGSDIKERVKAGKRIPDWMTFSEVARELKKAYPEPSEQGITIFLTGLSGAGKSTIAKILYSKFLEIGTRPVSLLDGDIVRHNLSSELSFSKEHRDINVRRIGFVASEITKNKGVAICAPIAPYRKTRKEIRANIEAYGGFTEVHVATPIEECEKRDRKGMYAKARAGLISGFTGVDDPYQEPDSPEVCIDTTNMTPDESAREILLVLGQKGYV